ncbi:MAG: DUF5304 domain-containing protein [Actinobacteria bacterium]|nr:DUF5304 domain-containing protein [Actinomycetota bacterium]
MPPAKKKKTTPTGSETPPVSPFQPGFAPECMSCPFGLFFYAMKNTRPDVMEHLMKAGFEVFQAFKGVVEQYGERWEQAQQLQKIPIS